MEKKQKWIEGIICSASIETFTAKLASSKGLFKSQAQNKHRGEKEYGHGYRGKYNKSLKLTNRSAFQSLVVYDA